jgi:small-conductance mechanosensitive channel
MPRRLRKVSPAGALALCACGLFGGDETSEAPQGAGTTESVTAQDSVVAPEEAGDQVVGPPVPAGDTAAPAATPEGVQAPTIEERLDQLLANQESLSRRLDSIAIAAAPADSARQLSGSGEVLEQAGNRVRSFGVGIVWSIVVIALFNLAIRGIVFVLDTLAEARVRRRLFFKRLVPIARIVLWSFAAYLIVNVIFQVDAQGLFAAAAAIGVAIGLAAQDLLKNLFGGLILVFDQPFQVGDKIRVGGTYGEVKSIGLRATRIVTADDNVVSVPNAQVVDQQVANANAGELNCQVVTDLYLPGWADELAAKRIAFEAAANSKYVYLNKPIVVLVADEFKETFLTRVRVKAYVLDPRLEFLFQSDVTERAREGFREAGLLKPDNMRVRLVQRSAAGLADGAASLADHDSED